MVSMKFSLALTCLLLTSCGKVPGRPLAKILGNGESKQGDGSGAETKVQPNPALEVPKAELLAKILGEEEPDCSGKPLASAKHLRLLTSDEYQNSAADILKLTSDHRGRLPQELKVAGFRNNVEKGNVSDAHAASYLDAAIAISDEVKAKLGALVACTEDAGESCAQKVIESIAPKLYRRPLADAEKAAALAVYKKAAEVSAREGMSALFIQLLTSPAFLYRSEIGDNNELTPYELASALSFFFWGSSPDEALTALAASGKLKEEATLLAEAERLWKDKRSRFLTTEFARSWLDSQAVKGASKDVGKFPNFTQEIKDAMNLGAEDTFDFYMKQEKAIFASLFQTDYSIGSSRLAEFYKGQASNEGNVNRIKFPRTPRKGVLGLGAILASHATAVESHPIKRGDFVLRSMFCFIPPPTPAGLDVQVPPPVPGLTTRERFAKHSGSPACAGCHVKIDGIGFGMEDYDSLGLFRAQDNGKAVDDAGTLIAIDGKDTPFKGTAAMSDLIAESAQSKRCFVLQWYRYAHGYLEREGDVCAVRDLGNAFAKGDLSLSQLLIKIITHSSYAKKGQ